MEIAPTVIFIVVARRKEPQERPEDAASSGKNYKLNL